jgi:hypothetical protein
MLARRPVQRCMSTLARDDEYVLQHVWSYKPYASGSVHLFGADWNFFPILSLSEASNQIRNTSLLFRRLSFLLLCWLSPLVCVTKADIPDLEIDRKIMKYAKRRKMETLYLC